MIIGVEGGEQVEHLVDDGDMPFVGPVDLVDRNDWPKASAQRLGNHEFGLRQWPLGRIDQHDDAVDHVEDALDLAAKIGVAGGIDDVDAGILPDQRSALRQDGDTAFAFEVVAVHHPFGNPLVVAECTGLSQQHVD